MAASTTLTIRVEQEVKDRLDDQAKKQRRSKSFIAAEAINGYLKVREWQEKRIVEALAAADGGQGATHQSVLDWIDAWDTDSEYTAPKA